jgi:uncharacterized integral membrane protein
MQFLKTLFWVALAVLLVLFASVNWNAVTLHLWGGLEADVKLPVLLLIVFLAGFLPTLIVHRARLWSLRRRYEMQSQQAVAAQNVPAGPGLSPAADTDVQPPIQPPPRAHEDRIATDAKAWPTP